MIDYMYLIGNGEWLIMRGFFMIWTQPVTFSIQWNNTIILICPVERTITHCYLQASMAVRHTLYF